MNGSSALILIDVLKGFFHPSGSLWYPEVDDVVEPLHQLLDTARRKERLVVHVAERHRTDVFDAEFDIVPEHLVAGHHDSEFLAGFEPREGEPVVVKRRYSGFFATDLALLLHELSVQQIVIAGVKTNVCIRATVTDGAAHGFRVVVPRQATNSNRSHLAAASLEDIERYLGVVTDLDSVLEML